MCVGEISCQTIYPHHHVFHLRRSRQHRDLSKPEPIPCQPIIENPIADILQLSENDIAWFYRACCIFLAEDIPEAAIPRLRDMPSTFFLHFVMEAIRFPPHPHTVTLLGGLLGSSMCDGNSRVEAYKNPACLNLSYRFYRTLLRGIFHLPGEPQRRDPDAMVETLSGILVHWGVYVYSDLIDEDKWNLMKFVGDVYDYHLYNIGGIIRDASYPMPDEDEHTEGEATPYMALLPHIRSHPQFIPQPPIHNAARTPTLPLLHYAPENPQPAAFIGPPRPPNMGKGGRPKGKDRKILRAQSKAASPAPSSPGSSVVFTPESSGADSPGSNSSDSVVFTPGSSA